MVCRGHWIEVEGLVLLVLVLVLLRLLLVLLGRRRRGGVEELRIQSGRVQECLVCLRRREQRFVKVAVEAAKLDEAVAALLVKGRS